MLHVIRDYNIHYSITKLCANYSVRIMIHPDKEHSHFGIFHRLNTCKCYVLFEKYPYCFFSLQLEPSFYESYNFVLWRSSYRSIQIVKGSCILQQYIIMFFYWIQISLPESNAYDFIIVRSLVIRYQGENVKYRQTDRQTHAHTHARTHAHAHAHTRTHTHTHIHIYTGTSIDNDNLYKTYKYRH